MDGIDVTGSGVLVWVWDVCCIYKKAKDIHLLQLIRARLGLNGLAVSRMLEM